jgi:MFS family permease
MSCASQGGEDGEVPLACVTRALFGAFFAMGFGFASWAARIPQVRDALNLGPGALGLLLLSIAAGSVLSLPVAGTVVGVLGAARAVTITALVSAAGLFIAGLGSRIGALPVAAGLFLLGAGNGTWLVAMNVEGTLIEHRLSRALLPRFHASYSIGTVAGALTGAAVVVIDISAMVHLIAVALGIALVVPWTASRFLTPVESERARDEPRRHPLTAWTEPRTLLLGLSVFCWAFIEGTGTDWIGVSVIDGYHARAAAGSLALGLFLAAMTAGRWFGTVSVDRFGRVASVRGSAVLACLGVILTVFGGWLPLAIVGVILWGVGGALGLPLGMSAAADDPVLAAGRVGVVTSIGWLAFLLGPPLVGLLGNRVGTLDALVAAAGFATASLLLSGVLRAKLA